MRLNKFFIYVQIWIQNDAGASHICTYTNNCFKFISAVKCNDDLTVLKVLADCGANFDCASKVSIHKFSLEFMP